MISHQACKHCYQRKERSEHTKECPARPYYGHEWETYSGNGITWDESLAGKLWETKFGKVVVIIFGIILLLMIL